MKKILIKILGENLVEKIMLFRQRGHFFSIPDERKFLFRELEEYLSSSDKNKKVLDIGAGEKPYLKLFIGYTYETSDMEDAFHSGQKHDYYCSIYDLSMNEFEYDKVFLFQVLEHLEHPIQGLKEVNRILKPGGEVFLSVPQGAGDHFEPYHFFNYTQYGLKSVLEQSGFEVVSDKRLSGIYVYISNRLSKLVGITKASMGRNYFAIVVFSPFGIALNLLSWCLSKVNFLDKKQNYCIGHIVVAKKI